MTSFQWRHRYYVIEKRHQTNVTKFFHLGFLPIKISGHASTQYIHYIIRKVETFVIKKQLYPNSSSTILGNIPGKSMFAAAPTALIPLFRTDSSCAFSMVTLPMLLLQKKKIEILFQLPCYIRMVISQFRILKSPFQIGIFRMFLFQLSGFGFSKAQVCNDIKIFKNLEVKPSAILSNHFRWIGRENFAETQQ